MAARFERMRDSIERAIERDEIGRLASPRIRLVVPPAMYASTRYVEASFRLSADAYVLVVAVDLDRRVRVLFPETPDESGFANSGPHRLTRFFAGLGGLAASGDGRSLTRYDGTGRVSPFGGDGVLLAIASDRPLQFERVMGQDGGWNELLLAPLIFDRSLAGAADAVGRALVLTGQEYGTDYAPFTDGSTPGPSMLFASSSVADCGYYNGYATPGIGYGVSYGTMGTALVGLYQRDGRTYARYASGIGSCNRPVYYDVLVQSEPAARGDTAKHDAPTVARLHPHAPCVPRVPSMPGDSSTPLARRLVGAAESEPARPPVAAGVRFRPAEQIPAEEIPHLTERTSPRDAPDSPDSPPHPRRWTPDAEPLRPSAPDARGGETVRPADRIHPAERSQEPRAEPVRAEPVRAEPVRAEPARVEPVRAEPMPVEPVRREPAPTGPR
jgi:hypothetical protein